ncbi:MAG: VirB3 family type IV secretion system protein [Parvibaculum sp.]|jgi:type IV secretory pathway TrbD component
MFEEPVPQALTKRLLTFGLPRELGIYIATGAAAGFFALHRWEPLVAGAAMFVIGGLIHKRDEWMFEILIRHIRYRDRYLA